MNRMTRTSTQVVVRAALRLALIPLITAAVVIAQEIEMSRWTIDGGGVMRSTDLPGADLELSGTIGQPDAGTMSGGEFTLTGGFWLATPPGDCEDDGDVDLADYALFQACMTGPAGAPPTGDCRCFDVNRSGTVDLADYAVIQAAHTGS